MKKLAMLAAAMGATDLVDQLLMAGADTTRCDRFGNTALHARAAQVARLRSDAQPTVPFTLAEELATNPFLRGMQSEVAASAERHCGKRLSGVSEVFAVLREWKNTFR